MESGSQNGPADSGGGELFRHFSDSIPQGVFSKVPCLTLAPFWLLLAPFGSLLAPFGSLLDPFGSLLALFGSLLVPKSLKELFGTLSAKHPKTIPRTLTFAAHRP